MGWLDKLFRRLRGGYKRSGPVVLQGREVVDRPPRPEQVHGPDEEEATAESPVRGSGTGVWWAQSPNGRVTLSREWADGRGMRVGCFLDGRPLWQKDFSSPLAGAAADTGHALVSYMTPRLELLVVFSPGGDRLLEKRFSNAGVYGCGIADDASMAWCSTSDNALWLFSLAPEPGVLGELIFPHSMAPRRDRECWTKRVEDGWVVAEEGGTHYRFSVAGEWLNYWDVLLARGEWYELLPDVADRLKEAADSPIAPAEYDELERALLRVDHERVSDSGRAKIRRCLGELALSRGDKAAALDHFRKALEWDPGVGVKRLFVRLEKELGGS